MKNDSKVQEDFPKVGPLHNDYLNKLCMNAATAVNHGCSVQDFVTISKKYISDNKLQVTDIDIKTYLLLMNDPELVYGNISKNYPNEIKEKIDGVLAEGNDIITNSKKYDLNDFLSLKENLDAIIVNYKSQDLDGVKYILSFSSTLRSSIDYWLNCTTNKRPTLQKLGMFWKILIGDAVGALLGIEGGVVSAAVCGAIGSANAAINTALTDENANIEIHTEPEIETNPDTPAVELEM